MWFKNSVAGRKHQDHSEDPIHFTAAGRQRENREERKLKDRRSRGSEFRFSALMALTLLLTAAIASHAERLPTKTYTTADGLPNNMVTRIVRDSHGFLWFCTLHGLSRFDGYTFRNYSDEQGLPGEVTDLLETGNGEYWVASENGLYQFSAVRSDAKQVSSVVHRPADSSRMFRLYRLNDQREARVNAVRQDRQGSIWVATSGGLYRIAQTAGQRTVQQVDLATPGKTSNRIRVQELYEDRDGAMWASLSGNGLRRFWPDGRVERYTTHGLLLDQLADSSDDLQVGEMLDDSHGRFWLGTDHGLSMLVRKPHSKQMEIARIYTVKDGLKDERIQALLESADGTLWVGTDTGLSEFCSASICAPNRFRSSTSPSLGRTGAWGLAEDKDGNLWMGNETGVLRMARSGFTTYDEADGLGSSRVFSMFEDAVGELYAITGGPGRPYINRFEGNHFISSAPRMPQGTFKPVSSPLQPALRDHTGDWWVTSDGGFFRYHVRTLQDLTHTLPGAVYTTHDGLPDGLISVLYEDWKGDVWIGSRSISTRSGKLTAWQRSTGTFHVFSLAEGLTTTAWPIAFSEDRERSLWVSFRDHSLARYRDGRFTVFTDQNGGPGYLVVRFYLDHQDRLWLATIEGGVARVDHPEDEHPHYARYTTAEGLSSNQVQAITEDEWGRIYFLTDMSVDRLDPKTGVIKHFTSADTPLSSHAGVALRDHQGTLWFGTLQGLSRFVPKPDEVVSPPSIRISTVRVRGESQAISELGETELRNLVLQPDQDQVEVEFASFSFSAGEQVRYQYRLDGADSDWSPVSDRRSVNYATLPAGRYRFRVRAVNWRGLVSAEPAEMEFQVLPPLWRRWWVQGLLGALVLSGSYALYRLRVGQLLELERVRTRIATDLHDDIGSSLTQISILSEVARREVGQNGQPAAEPLARIAELSRELVDSMSDIVWAVNPRRDRISDLEHRMRRFASDVLSARNIAFDFHASDGNSDRELRTDKRREVFLVFKEGVNNIVRHSQCKNVTIELTVERGHLLLRLCDDGTGFDPARLSGDERHPGHGMRSMVERAKSLGAELTVNSKHGQGTILAMRVPL